MSALLIPAPVKLSPAETIPNGSAFVGPYESLYTPVNFSKSVKAFQCQVNTSEGVGNFDWDFTDPDGDGSPGTNPGRSLHASLASMGVPDTDYWLRYYHQLNGFQVIAGGFFGLQGSFNGPRQSLADNKYYIGIIMDLGSFTYSPGPGGVNFDWLNVTTAFAPQSGGSATGTVKLIATDWW